MKLRRIVTVILTAVMLFSVPVSVSAFYPVYFSENFTDAGTVYSTFLISNDWILDEEGGLYGDADAKVIQTYPCDIPEWWENYPTFSYVDYDMTVTLAAGDDRDSEDDRFVSLVYVNDNLIVNGASDERVYMSFIYDFQEDCFRLAKGLSQTDPEKQIMPPVYMEISDDGSEYYTLGMTVERDRIRCFCNGELIFDFIDTDREYFIADQVEDPLLFWQEGNFTKVKNISVNRPGYLLDPTYNVGDADGDGSIDLADVAAAMKHIAKWKDIGISAYAADADRNGKVNISDVTMMLKTIAEW